MKLYQSSKGSSATAYKTGLLLQITSLVNLGHLEKNKGNMGFPGFSNGKESTCSVGNPRFDPSLGKIPWRRKWQPTPVLLPAEPHGQRSLEGYNPWGHKESDMTEVT